MRGSVLKVCALAAVPAMLATWGCSEDGGSGGGGRGDGGASDGGRGDVGDLDAGGGGGDGGETPPLPTWARTALGSDPVVGIAADGEAIYVLTAGAIHIIRDGQVQTEARPELAWPVALHGRGDTVAAVGFDLDGNSWAVVHDGMGWRTADLPGEPCPAGPPCTGVVGARAPAGVDVGADGVVRVPAFGVVTGLLEDAGELLPYEEVTFSGNDELQFHTLRSFGASGNWLFSGVLAMNAADFFTWSAFRQFGGALLTAEAYSGAAAFLALPTELLHFRADSLDTFHRVVTPQGYTRLAPQADEFALALGPAGRLAVVGPRIEGDGQDVQAAGALGLQVIDLGTTVDLTAALVAPDQTVWVGGSDGTLWRYGVDAPADWTPIAGDHVRFGDPTAPEPMDAGVDGGVAADQGPPEPTTAAVRFIGLAAAGGTFVCNGSEALGPEVGVWGNLPVVLGDVFFPPGVYRLEEDVGAAGTCRGLGLDEFTLRVQAGGQHTVLVGLSLALGADVLTDDSTPAAAGTMRYRIYGIDRRGTDRFQNLEYCVDGAPLPGGSAPRTGYLEHPVGPLDIEVREVAQPPCSGALKFGVGLQTAEGQVRSLFLAPGTDTGPVKPEPDLLVVDCVDGDNGRRPEQAVCVPFYVDRQVGE